MRRLLSASADPTGAETLRLSDFIESEPWGFDSANRFLNIGVNILTDLPPLELLEITQMAEREVSDCPHRATDGTTYIDRAIDIDIIWYEGVECEGDRLTLPHPRATQRDFVTVPFRQLNPGRSLKQ